MKCERIDGKTPCKTKAVAYRCGQWVCAKHRPTGRASCSHSLRGVDNACLYCGAEAVTP